eukprot:6418887-Prymnesium_polylepis.1
MCVVSCGVSAAPCVSVGADPVGRSDAEVGSIIYVYRTACIWVGIAGRRPPLVMSDAERPDPGSNG